MRVAVDVTIPDRAVTGVGVYARGLLSGLARRTVDVRRWQRPLAPPGYERLRNGCRLIKWHEYDVPKRIRAEAIDVYHSACSVGPVSRTCPTVLTVHDAHLLEDRSYGYGSRMYRRLFSVAAARRAAAVIVPTVHARTAVARSYRLADHQLFLVPHGLDPGYHRPDAAEIARVRAASGLTAPYVLVVGVASPRKNGARVFDAFVSAVRDREAPVDLAVVGPVCATMERSVAAHPSVATRVRRLGVVPAADLPALYAGARCLAYVSLAEGFGLPILEAMACGTPVVTSRGGATEEVAGSAARLVDPRDTTDIAAALRAVLSDDALCAGLAASGLARSAVFSWDRTAELTERVYRAVGG
jgi:glycosyltransferase involved in cell wall biosynthesis